MRAVYLLLIAVVCAAYASFESVAPTASLVEVDASFESALGVDMEVESELSAEIEAEAEVDAEAEAEVEYDWEEATRNANLETRRARKNNRANRKPSLPYDSLDWSHIPSADSLPGDLVRIRNAPGAANALSEETLDKSLFPRKGCTDPNHVEEIKTWNLLTQRIRIAKATAVKYVKWMAAARAALKKIATQAKVTKSNLKLLNQSVRGMTYQRKQLVKRLKAYKLKARLDAAQERMSQLHAHSKQLGKGKFVKIGGKKTNNKGKGKGGKPSKKPTKPTKPGKGKTGGVKPAKKF